MFPHERVVVRRGPESGLPIIVAVHSTSRGPAIGGCRLKSYPDWRAGLSDALRLSAAMTDKCALAGLPHGGGKTVVVLPPDGAWSRPAAQPLHGDASRAAAQPPDGDASRAAALHDVGTTIAELAGAYATGPDVGTGPDDMAVIGERTEHVFCRPDRSGDSSPATAAGTVAALRALCEHRFGSPDLSRRSFAILGLGRVGGAIAGLLRDSRLVVSDLDESRRVPGAAWTSPEECLRADVDVLVPAALGGVLTAATVPTLRCAAIAGPANNQLDRDDTAALLYDRGIVFAPDAVVSAGGIIYATGIELRGRTPAEARADVEAIGDTLGRLLRAAAAQGLPPAEVARRMAATAA
ncbi:amino acid dehydrogenase [Actinoplanes sp. KI2]|uniref:Glu/Leu/Phe/Val dehydrogenase dimerization domain-containing protein n=1 Tax=Actinoplanes sp. KI2 TaxID=2983315 RepID=UPI0021D61430|nr:Glu/Leu/Phe/Val dehydrogenase dimerization domain-containing protein [Actinoplanes sp. KI2]MCU7725768.1 amino acid dehydrogenase [Actinoplanes sp. KI2]